MKPLPYVSNIKGNFKIKIKNNNLKDRCKNLDSVKIFHNFLVIKNIFTYIVFYSSGHINFTGVNHFFKIKKCIKHFLNILKLKKHDYKILTIKIDNITCSGKFGKYLNLKKLKKEVISNKQSEIENIQVTSNTSYFSGTFVKFPKIGTVIIFPNGSYSMVGIKCRKNITILFHKVTALISML